MRARVDERRYPWARDRLAWVKAHVPEGARLLDAAAGLGHFLNEARRHFDAVGIEAAASEVDWSRAFFDVESRVGVPEELTGSYDAVTYWDALERTPSPRPVLDALAALVAPGGFLFLSTPNAESRVATMAPSLWPRFQVAAFTVRALTRALDARGFDIVDIRTLHEYFRPSYTLDRVREDYGVMPVRVLVSLARKIGRPLMHLDLPIAFGDVMGVAARKRPASADTSAA